MKDDRTPKLSPETARFVIIIIFLLAQTYLLANGHQQLSSDILRVDAQTARACQEALK